MPLSAADYRPRDAEHAVLYRVIAEHLEAFLETAKRHADGSPLPGWGPLVVAGQSLNALCSPKSVLRPIRDCLVVKQKTFTNESAPDGFGTGEA